MTRKAAVGDIVRVDEDTRPWRVSARDPKARTLTLESLTAYPRQTWDGVDEERAQPSAAFS